MSVSKAAGKTRMADNDGTEANVITEDGYNKLLVKSTSVPYITRVANGEVAGFSYVEQTATNSEIDKDTSPEDILTYTVPVDTKAYLLSVDGSIGPSPSSGGPCEGLFIIDIDATVIFESTMYSRGYGLDRTLDGTIMTAGEVLTISFDTNTNNTRVSSRIRLIEEAL